MNRWLPSKKATVVFGVFVIALVGTIIILKFKDSSVSYIPNVEKIKTAIKTNNSDVDSDGDGLKDWEEVLYHTDPNNPDTDGDGVVDGVNVSVVTSGKELKNSDGSVNETNTVAKNIADSYLKMYNDGTLNQDSVSQSISGILGGLNLTAQPSDKYSKEDLNIVDSSEVNFLTNYFKQITDVTVLLGGIDESLYLLNDVLENGNKDSIVKLNDAVSVYQTIQNKLLSVDVPKDVAGVHIDTINRFQDVIDGTKSMANIYEDPLSTLSGINKYVDSVEKIKSNFAVLGVYLKQKGVNII